MLRFFKWDVKTQPVEAMDSLEPFHTAEFPRRAEPLQLGVRLR